MPYKKLSYKRQKFYIENLSKTPEYSTWNSLKRRCIDKNHEKYPNYGGRGITVYQPWIDNFHLFYIYLNSTIGLRPNSDYSIDRIDNDGNYEPGNIQWLTNQEQCQKKRNTVLNPTLVRYIRHQRDTTSRTIRDLATELDVGWNVIYSVWKNKSWINII